MDRGAGERRGAGYLALAERYALDVMPHWHQSWVGGGSTRRIEAVGTHVEETYQVAYWPGESLGDQLEFALKYDGTNLGILSQVFAAADAAELQHYVESKPTGKYARRAWYLYEFLTGERLPIEDLRQGNYVDVLDADTYYVMKPARRVRRQRVNDNLLGDRRFCPVIRRTEELTRLEEADLRQRCREVVESYSPELLQRALSYLYTRETKSSFEIEREAPSAIRTERFIALLRSAEAEDFCNKPSLIEVQNRIVDDRYREEDYRDFQNYIGQTISFQRARMHYVCPTPAQVDDLMAGLLASHESMGEAVGSAVVHAAVVAYGFVYIHPFGDGNGRIHRFLIHNILSLRGFTPEGLMFPVSAAMLSNPVAYDASLEAFSAPLLQLVDYTLDESGEMKVQNDVGVWYRYPDLTAQAQALAGFIEATIEVELVEELSFISNYGEAKDRIQATVDLPDRRIDQFIRFCLQNNGKLSARKRSKLFEELTDAEVRDLEAIVQEVYGEESADH